MRTDAIFDRRAVRVPNASQIGYSAQIARVGDFINFTGHRFTTTGRMIGRVHWAPSTNEHGVIKNWILAICIGSDLGHTFERWIDPKDVTQCEPPSCIARKKLAVAWFLSDEIFTADMNEVRTSTEHGYGSVHEYREWRNKLARDIEVMNARAGSK